MIKLICFDLDDTLYNENDFVKSGFIAVSEYLEDNYSIKNVYPALEKLYKINKKNVFNRLLDSYKIEYNQNIIKVLLDIYHYHTDLKIFLNEETKKLLIDIKKRGYYLGIITDGIPKVQRNKIKTLLLEDLVDYYIVTDEFGSIEYRKPNPISFKQILNHFNLTADEMLYIGDNPKKDFAVSQHLPIHTVHYKNVESLYLGSDYLNDIKPEFMIDDLTKIFEIIKELNSYYKMVPIERTSLSRR